MLVKIEKAFDKFADIIGAITSIAIVLMIFNVTYDVIMRYFFRSGSIAFQEMEWHLFSVVILLGMAYTLKEDGHVRVDLIYDGLTDKRKALIDMIGVITFILPIAFLIINASIPYVIETFQSGEISGDPGGLTHRWIVKSLIPLSFILLVITSIGFFIRNLNIYRGVNKRKLHGIEEELAHLKEDTNEHKGDNK
ncbi:MAG: TRAP transporter small permease subunit [Campylobacteraceae bacterium]|nr:TRAP transporter small permease subunit [Campylobacteraceae bacterium]